MNRSSLIAILGSIVLAAFVAWLGNTWIERRLSSTEKPPEMTKVLVAAKDIPIDTKIDVSQIRLVELPSASVPPGHLTSPDQILGKRLKEAVYSGEVILKRRLLEDSAASVLSVTLSPGKRAVAVRVDDIIGVSGFLVPGSHVDVIASGRGQGARTVLQDIKVLTVGQVLKAEGGNLRAGSVTLEVDPRQAEILMEATVGGNVRLALRHQLDRSFVASPETAAATPPEEGTVTMAPAPEATLSSAPAETTPPEAVAELLAATDSKRMRSIIVIKGMKETRTGSQWEFNPDEDTSQEAKP